MQQDNTNKETNWSLDHWQKLHQLVLNSPDGESLKQTIESSALSSQYTKIIESRLKKMTSHPSVSYNSHNKHYTSLLHFLFTSLQPSSCLKKCFDKAVVLVELGEDPLDFVVQAVQRVGVISQFEETVDLFISTVENNLWLKDQIRAVINHGPELTEVFGVERLMLEMSEKDREECLLQKESPAIRTTLKHHTTVPPFIQLCGSYSMQMTSVMSSSPRTAEKVKKMLNYFIDELGVDPNIIGVVDIAKTEYYYGADNNNNDDEDDEEDEEEDTKEENTKETVHEEDHRNILQQNNIDAEEEQDANEGEDDEEEEEEEDHTSTYKRPKKFFKGYQPCTQSAFIAAVGNSNIEVAMMILEHPKFDLKSFTSDPSKINEMFAESSSSFVSGETQLRLLRYFPHLSGFMHISGTADIFFGKRKNQQKNENEDNHGDNDDDSDQQQPFIDPEIDASKISQEDFEKYHTHIYGRSNPERRGKGDPVIQQMFPSMCTSYTLRKAFNETHYSTTSTKVKGPVWSYDRFGVAVVPLDSCSSSSSSSSFSKYLLIGGEVEDHYDPDFFIYNDVFVVDSETQEYEMFAYPREVFPPTDFHTATLVPRLGCVFIIGCVGYVEERDEFTCPVYRLDLVTMKITKVETKNRHRALYSVDDGEKEGEEKEEVTSSSITTGPGWISRHFCWYDEQKDALIVEGGDVYKSVSQKENDDDNNKEKKSEKKMTFDKDFMKGKRFLLHLDDFTWTMERK